MDTSQPIYFLSATGVHRVSFTDLGPVDRLAEHIGQNLATRIPNVFGGRQVCLKQGACYVSERLTQVNFRTFFAADGEHLVPVFREMPDALQMSLVWNVPASLELRFGMSTYVDGGRHFGSEYHLFAKSQRQTGFWKLPLPNVYPDSRVCMGRGWQPEAGSLEHVLTQALHQFNTAPWNTDLLDHPEQAKRLFRWSGETSVLVDDWEQHCVRVSHPALELL